MSHQRFNQLNMEDLTEKLKGKYTLSRLDHVDSYQVAKAAISEMAHARSIRAQDETWGRTSRWDDSTNLGGTDELRCSGLRNLILTPGNEIRKLHNFTSLITEHNVTIPAILHGI